MKNELVWAVVIIIALFATTWYLTNRPSPSEDADVATDKIKNENMADVTELKMTDTLVGTGALAETGKKITVHYTGTLLDGTKFDSSVDRGQPFSFTLGVGQVIKGWDQGFAGMKVGGKRELIIPASLAYGERQMGSIPANSTLKFEVELLGVE